MTVLKLLINWIIIIFVLFPHQVYPYVYSKEHGKKKKGKLAKTLKSKGISFIMENFNVIK